MARMMKAVCERERFSKSLAMARDNLDENAYCPPHPDRRAPLGEPAAAAEPAEGRTLLGLVPISLAIFTTIILTALLPWGLAEIPCRWAAGETPSKPGPVPGRND